MNVSLESILPALAGGALVGASASVMLLVVGRIAGVSGALGGVARLRTGDIGWRAGFLGGLVLGGVLLAIVAPGTISAPAPVPMGWVAVAGLLVGVGTQLGNGCTSGHGVCGVSRFSGRSLAATMMFLLTGASSAVVMRQILGGVP